MATSDHRKPWANRFLSRQYVAAAAVGIGALTVTGYICWCYRTVGIPIESLRIGQYNPGEILVRTTSPQSDIVLIGAVSNLDVTRIRLGGGSLVPTGPVYRFIAQSVRLEPSGLDEWTQATGAITFRYSDRDFSTGPIELDVQTGSVTVGRTSLSTAGAYTLDIDVSPDRKFVNAVSANAPKGKGSFMFFFGGGGGAYPRGPFYHETLDRLNGAKVGPTYTLEYPGQRVSLSYCWEAQGRYVIYHDGEGRFLWVVPGPNDASNQVAPKPTPGASPDAEEKSDDK